MITLWNLNWFQDKREITFPSVYVSNWRVVSLLLVWESYETFNICPIEAAFNHCGFPWNITLGGRKKGWTIKRCEGRMLALMVTCDGKVTDKRNSKSVSMCVWCWRCKFQLLTTWWDCWYLANPRGLQVINSKQVYLTAPGQRWLKVPSHHPAMFSWHMILRKCSDLKVLLITMYLVSFKRWI